MGYGGGDTLLGMSVVGCQAKSTRGGYMGGYMGGYIVMAASRGAWVPGVQHDGHDLWSVSASSGLHPISDLSSKIDTRPFHGDVST